MIKLSTIIEDNTNPTIDQQNSQVQQTKQWWSTQGAGLRKLAYGWTQGGIISIDEREDLNKSIEDLEDWFRNVGLRTQTLDRNGGLIHPEDYD